MNRAGSVSFEAPLEQSTLMGNSHYIGVPDEVAEQFSRAVNLRLVCTLNETLEFQCALRPKGNGLFFISIGAFIRRQGKLTLGQKLRATIRQDTSPYGRDMPEELEELFLIDNEGQQRFHKLSPGRQRSIIYYVAAAKVVQTRIDRAIRMIDRLKK